MIRRKSKGEMGHPCATPDPSWKDGPRYPLTYSLRDGGWSWEYTNWTYWMNASSYPISFIALIPI